MALDAVIFDLDGTLLDTLDDLADSMNAALGALSLPTHPVGAYRLFVGDGVRNLVLRALPPSRRDEATVRSGLDGLRREYSLRWHARTRPYPGVEALLDELARRGLPAGVLSNKPDEFVRPCVAKLLPRHSFRVVRGEIPGVPRKPDPAGALAVAGEMGVGPAEVLYLGDSGTDMRTAVAAGMFPVGAAWGFRSVDELTAGGAAAVVRSPGEVLRFLLRPGSPA